MLSSVGLHSRKRSKARATKHAEIEASTPAPLKSTDAAPRLTCSSVTRTHRISSPPALLQSLEKPERQPKSSLLCSGPRGMRQKLALLQAQTGDARKRKGKTGFWVDGRQPGNKPESHKLSGQVAVIGEVKSSSLGFARGSECLAKGFIRLPAETILRSAYASPVWLRSQHRRKLCLLALRC